MRVSTLHAGHSMIGLASTTSLSTFQPASSQKRVALVTVVLSSTDLVHLWRKTAQKTLEVHQFETPYLDEELRMNVKYHA